jgi:hypothetical protein
MLLSCALHTHIPPKKAAGVALCYCRWCSECVCAVPDTAVRRCAREGWVRAREAGPGCGVAWVHTRVPNGGPAHSPSPRRPQGGVIQIRQPHTLRGVQSGRCASGGTVPAGNTSGTGVGGLGEGRAPNADSDVCSRVACVLPNHGGGGCGVWVRRGRGTEAAQLSPPPPTGAYPPAHTTQHSPKQTSGTRAAHS